MSRGLLIGRLFGTDIYASPSFLLLMAVYFFAYRNPAAVAIFLVALILSLLVHEFGHVFAVKWLLKGRAVILLWMLGGLCIHERTTNAKKQLGISLMGPAFGFALAGVAWAIEPLVPRPGVWAGLVAMLLWINVLWNALNLLPLWPLDGGQALRAALALRIGGAKAAVAVRRISIFTAVAGIAVALQSGYFFAAILATMLLLENLRPGAIPHD